MTVGRSITKIDLRAGAVAVVKGLVKPAFALVSPDVDQPSERLLEVEAIFNDLATIAFFVPSAPDVQRVVAANPSLRQFLKDPMTLQPRQRSELSSEYCRLLDVQGVAIFHAAGGESDVRLLVFRCGSAKPDTLSFSLADRSSLTRVIERLEFNWQSLSWVPGFTAIDVADQPGPIVGLVEPETAKLGVSAGDRILSINERAITSAGQMYRIAQELAQAGPAFIEFQGTAGAARKISLPIRPYVRAVSGEDETLPFNTLSATLQARKATAEPALQAAIGLNIGIALINLGAFSQAVTELRDITLPAGSPISPGDCRLPPVDCLRCVGQAR